jgi:hypothetical protein
MARATSSGGKTTTLTAQGAIAAFAADPSMAPVAISDTTANIGRYLDGLQNLAAAGAISSIRLSDTKTMTITGAQFTADAQVIALLPVRQFIIVDDALATLADTLQVDPRVKTFRVTDSSANVTQRLDALNDDTRLTAVTLTDTTALTMSHAQLVSNTSVLGKLPAGTTYIVTAVSAANAATTEANTKVVSLAVSDNAFEVATRAATLNGLAKLTSVTVSDTGANILSQLNVLNGVTDLGVVNVTDTDTLTITAGTYLNHMAVWAKLAPGEGLAVTAALASQVGAIAANAAVASLSVSDTLDNIGATLAELDALAKTGRLGTVTVTDTGDTLFLTTEEQAAYQDVLAVMVGTFTIAEPAPARPPVINLIWDESVALAPTGFVAAVEYAASFFDSLITSPITINIEVGWGEARDTALGTGLLGEAYVMTGLFKTYAEYGAALAAHNTSATIDTALAYLMDPGRQVFVPGAQGKAMGLVAADAAATDGAIGFKADASLYTFDPANRAVAGKVDLIGLAQHEITHTLGRVSYSWGTTGFDLYRYSAPGVWSATNTGSTYLSIDGGVTNLGDFSQTGDPADWDHDHPEDAQSAFLGTGMEFIYSEADIIALNAMGFAISGAPTVSGGTSVTTDPLVGGSGARMSFLPAEMAETALDVTLFSPGFDLAPEHVPPGGLGGGVTDDSSWRWMATDGASYF